MRPGFALTSMVIGLLGVSPNALVADDSKDKKESAKIELKTATVAEIEKHVASQKGKPVAMDVWATWCVPCREKFPKFVALAGKLKDNASFFSLTIDEEDAIADAKKFLEKSKATFANFHAKDGAEAIEKKFGFEGVPQYVVWEDGKIVLRTNDVVKLEEKLKELLPPKKEEK